MRALLVSMMVAAASLSIASEARADDASPSTSQRGVITVPGFVIYGRLPRPTVAVEIDRIAPKFASSETSLPLLDRIEGTVYEALFF
jgi:hypothetical protein